MVERRGTRWWRLAAGAALAAATAAAWPSVAAGAHDLTDETLPTMTLPPVTLPPLTLPPVSTPGLTTPPLSTPIAEVPSLVVPPVTLPPLVVGDGDGAATTTIAPVAPTVPPAASAVTTGRAPVGELPASSGPGSAGVPGADASGVPAAPAPAAVASPATEMRPLGVRLRQAAAETVGWLSFPLGLAVAIACFLLVQHRLDRDDPRMTPAAPADDELLEFS